MKLQQWQSYPNTKDRINYGLGVFKDIAPRSIPIGGFLRADQWHCIDNSMETYPGWAKYPDIETPINLTDPVLLVYECETLDTTTSFIIFGTGKKLYLYDSALQTVTALNGSNFSTETGRRWQTAALNNEWFFSNGEDGIQKFDGATLAAITGDAQVPDSARYMISFMNRIVVANTYEGTQQCTQRFRSCEPNDTSIWVPNTGVNEAFFMDLDEGYGEIRGLAALGPQRFVLYYRSAMYVVSYVGGDVIYNIQRVISDEGLEYPYSLVSLADNHFGIGKRGFFVFNGNSIRDIGKDKIWNYFKQDMMPDEPGAVYGFAHPTYPEIWWIYSSNQNTSINFDKCLVYNWQTGGWFMREYFPHSAMGVVRDPDTSNIASLTNTFAEATLTWYEKRRTGAFSTIN